MKGSSSQRKNNRKKIRRKRMLKKIVLFSVVLTLMVLVGSIGVLYIAGEQNGNEASFAEKYAETDVEEVVYEESESIEAEQEDKREELPAEEEMSVSNSVEETEVTSVSDNEAKAEGVQKDSYAEKKFYITPKNPGEVELVFGGDICFYDDFALMVSYRARNNDINKCISEDLLNEIHGADIFMLNNEFAYSNRGQPLPEKAYIFRSKPENVEILNQLGVDIVGLANNHVWDYGQEAMLDTLTVLEEAGMPYVGAGRNLSEACMPAYFDCGEFTVAYVNATQIERIENPDTKGATANSPGTFRCFNETEFVNLKDTIREAKGNADFVVVYIHWGTENTDELDWAQTYQAPLIAEAGADLIIGNHTHCLQGIDYMGKTPVIYSVGNFWFNSKELDTCIVKAVVTKEGLKSFQFVPAKQQNCATSLLHDGEKIRVLDYMRSVSPNVLLDENGYINKKTLDSL